jgi:NhaA family Na+:H+ antiporter
MLADEPPRRVRDRGAMRDGLTAAIRPFQEFVRTEAAAGVALLGSTVVALVWANSPWSPSYFHLWESSLAAGVGSAALTKTVHEWINDGLMAVFFLLVGLEIKRELLVGELASVRHAVFPVAAALGGIAVPAIVYLAFNLGTPAARGWAIPVATDIAFALGILALLGSRVPASLKVFLTAIAIVDDIGAVLIIALFYTADVAWLGLASAAAIVAILAALNVLGVRRLAVYLLLGFGLWLAILSAGIHATLAGIILAMVIPATSAFDREQLIDRASESLSDLDEVIPGAPRVLDRREQETIHSLATTLDEARSPLMKLEGALHGVVAFGILPLFALANAGVALTLEGAGALSWRVVAGVALGLLAGKFLGIRSASALTRRLLGMRPMPDVSARGVRGAAWMAGIGFTMSLFISDLAFGPGALLDSAKIGVIAGSIAAGAAGWWTLRSLPKPNVQGDEPVHVIEFPRNRASARGGTPI